MRKSHHLPGWLFVFEACFEGCNICRMYITAVSRMELGLRAGLLFVDLFYCYLCNSTSQPESPNRTRDAAP